MNKSLTFGFPKMVVEAGERRAYLPEYIARLDKLGAQIFLEHGYGSGMGYGDSDYTNLAPSVQFVSHKEAYKQEYVFVLRCPERKEIYQMKPGSCLISMLHYPTRPERTAFINSLNLQAISLDSLTDDSGRRLVENLRAVGWNGVEVSFRTLRSIYPSPGFESPHRKPIQVTLMGSGGVGIHVVQAAIRYGDIELWKEMIERNVPGVQVTVVDFDTTREGKIMIDLLNRTDILVDATQRPDPSKPVIPNEWILNMPKHAILLDLSVDPYECGDPPQVVKGIEGIPQGDLDQFVFAPDDPAFEEVPECISKEHRRYTVSCYSWPGIYPRECMRVYGKQLNPIFRTLISQGGLKNIRPRGHFFERAIHRSLLSNWISKIQ